MFIGQPARPPRECPRCSAIAYRIAHFSEFRVRRRCNACGLTDESETPPLAPKRLYLDQFALSEMRKALDPVEGSNHDRRLWATLFDRLDRAVKLHVLVCPESPLHDRETRLTEHADTEQALREHLSGGVDLHEPSSVHELQLSQAYRAWSRGDPSAAVVVESRYAFRGSMASWQDPIRISVRMRSEPLEELQRTTEQRMGNAMTSLVTGWEAEIRSGATRTTIYERERRGKSDAILQCLIEGRPGGMMRFAKWVLEEEVAKGASEREAFERLKSFLYSDHALLVPANEIKSRLWGALAWSIGKGNKNERSISPLRDMDFISAYLPYVDAMLIDRFFAAQLREPFVSPSLQRYPCGIFSAAQLESLIAWVDQLEADMNPELRRTVLDLYGESFLVPFRGIIASKSVRVDRRRISGEEGKAS